MTTFSKIESIAVLGYGSQGRAHALNLRDAGHSVHVGLRPGGSSWTQALKDGFKPLSFSEATRTSDVVVMLLPDRVHQDVFETSVCKALKEGHLLVFAHGFSVHYGCVVPPEKVDVALVAPKSPGDLVRREYLRGAGVPCLIGVHQDASGEAWQRVEAYANGIGGGRAGLIKTSFAEETETDLFGEQAVLCGGVSQLVKAGFETLTEAGYQPEVAYFECLHELKLIVDLLHEGGLSKMHHFISDTASYGDLTRGSRVVDERARQGMKAVLTDIQSGRFAREWLSQEGGRWKTELLKPALSHPMEHVGARLREQMTWLNTGRTT